MWRTSRSRLSLISCLPAVVLHALLLFSAYSASLAIKVSRSMFHVALDVLVSFLLIRHEPEKDASRL